MKMRSVYLVLIISVLDSGFLAGQQANQKERFCDDNAGHVCWYGGEVVDGWGNVFKDEVIARGRVWMSEAGGNNLEYGNIAIRCVKRFGVCILSQGPNNIELLPITSWGDLKITAKSEHYDDNQCVLTSYVANRAGPVERFDASGPDAGSSRCGTVPELKIPRRILR